MQDVTSQKLFRLEQKVNFLANQVELERQKTFSLMSAVINKFDLRVVDAKSEFSSIAPIERLSGKTDFAVLAFAGLTLALGMPVPEFYRMSSQYEQTVYFIKDHAQGWYQRGLLGLSHDIPSTTSVLQQITAATSTDLRSFWRKLRRLCRHPVRRSSQGQ